MTMISNATPCCATSEVRQSLRDASSLRAGTMTETVRGSLAVSLAGIGRIYYYSGVRAMIRFVDVVARHFDVMVATKGRSSFARPDSRGRLSPHKLFCSIT